ncbi:phosphopantetheine-binding protein [Vandammella animalimorsus]|uniref:Phosphopantetheine-binding protein n=1 Tax=Vandammella animalimorsus TaxID=2029117 RepID=A0A2A2AL35_9BURK|nr:phosphopantetheine-binding protein [Vandammella animalimorsus]PAT38424.1 phosphopantetheine-binding protein [Vandammella animalimorsus]RMX15711.1 phosphopantetheine-binding protein [Vandammella animalimorsus]
MPQELLTLERMRADIARMLHESPDAIALDDNLIDWGLDSMRVLNLLLAWNETGIGLDFSEIAEHTTLRGWWQVVQQRLAQMGR